MSIEKPIFDKKVNTPIDHYNYNYNDNNLTVPLTTVLTESDYYYPVSGTQKLLHYAKINSGIGKSKGDKKESLYDDIKNNIDSIRYVNQNDIQEVIKNTITNKIKGILDIGAMLTDIKELTQIIKNTLKDKAHEKISEKIWKISEKILKIVSKRVPVLRLIDVRDDILGGLIDIGKKRKVDHDLVRLEKSNETKTTSSNKENLGNLELKGINIHLNSGEIVYNKIFKKGNTTVRDKIDTHLGSKLTINNSSKLDITFNSDIPNIYNLHSSLKKILFSGGTNCDFVATKISGKEVNKIKYNEKNAYNGIGNNIEAGKIIFMRFPSSGGPSKDGLWHYGFSLGGGNVIYGSSSGRISITKYSTMKDRFKSYTKIYIIN